MSDDYLAARGLLARLELLPHDHAAQAREVLHFAIPLAESVGLGLVDTVTDAGRVELANGEMALRLWMDRVSTGASPQEIAEVIWVVLAGRGQDLTRPVDVYRFTYHHNDLDDWCPWSHCMASDTGPDTDGRCCPAGCAASRVEAVTSVA